MSSERLHEGAAAARHSALSTTLKLAVSVAALGIIATRVDLAGTFALLARTDWVLLCAACVVLGLQWPITTLRFALLSRKAGAALSTSQALRIQLASLLMSQAVPTVGGDAWRTVALQRSGLALTRAIGVAITDRYFALLALASIVLAGQPWLHDSLDASPGLAAVRAGLGLVLIALCAVVVSDRVLPKSDHRLLTALASFGPTLRDALVDARVAPLALSASLAAHLITVAVVALLARALQLELSVAHAVLLVPPIVLLSALPISLAGWGVREGGSIALFSMAGMPASGAVAVSMLLGVLQLLVSLPGAVAIVVERRRASEP